MSSKPRKGTYDDPIGWTRFADQEHKLGQLGKEIAGVLLLCAGWTRVPDGSGRWTHKRHGRWYNVVHAVYSENYYRKWSRVPPERHPKCKCRRAKFRYQRWCKECQRYV